MGWTMDATSSGIETDSGGARGSITGRAGDTGTGVTGTVWTGVSAMGTEWINPASVQEGLRLLGRAGGLEAYLPGLRISDSVCEQLPPLSLVPPHQRSALVHPHFRGKSSSSLPRPGWQLPQPPPHDPYPWYGDDREEECVWDWVSVKCQIH